MVKNIFNILGSHDEPWQSDLVGSCNKTNIRVRTMKEMETQFHEHLDSDETFIVLSGELEVFSDENATLLKKGDLFTVPQGVSHRVKVSREVKLIILDSIN